jgi:hypothetical protein
MKLLGHRPGLPGNVKSFYIVPLDPAHSAGLAGSSPDGGTLQVGSLEAFVSPEK